MIVQLLQETPPAYGAGWGRAGGNGMMEVGLAPVALHLSPFVAIVTVVTKIGMR